MLFQELQQGLSQLLDVCIRLNIFVLAFAVAFASVEESAEAAGSGHKPYGRFCSFGTGLGIEGLQSLEFSSVGTF